MTPPILDTQALTRIYGGEPVDYTPGKPITWRFPDLAHLEDFVADAKFCGIALTDINEDALTVRCSWWQLYYAQRDEVFGVE